VETRPVLRIFISSTAIDLRDYLDKVRDAVLRLEDLPIAMETFSAQSGVGESISKFRRAVTRRVSNRGKWIVASVCLTGEVRLYPTKISKTLARRRNLGHNCCRAAQQHPFPVQAAPALSTE
jgi:hypothetical protein